MANFKVIYRVDKASEGEGALTWEPGCPLTFEAIQVSRNVDNGQAFLQAKVRNISNQPIRSFKVVLEVFYEEGISEAVDINPLDADIAKGSTYVLKPVALSQGDVKSVEAAVERVRLAGSTWGSYFPPLPMPKPKAAELSESAIEERCKQVWGFPNPRNLSFARNSFEEYDGWWLCPCGQLNVGSDTCFACKASLDKLRGAGAEDEDALKGLAAEREMAARRVKARKRKRVGVAVAAALVIVVLAFAALLVFREYRIAKVASFFDGGVIADPEGAPSIAGFLYEPNGSLRDCILTAEGNQTLTIAVDRNGSGVFETWEGAVSFSDGKILFSECPYGDAWHFCRAEELSSRFPEEQRGKQRASDFSLDVELLLLYSDTTAAYIVATIPLF